MPGEVEGSERIPAPAHNIAIEFPNDLGLSLGGAGGLVACSDAQFGLGSGSPAGCPAQSRIGTVELVSDVLGGPLQGAIYVGEGRPGERVRSLVAIAGPGVTFKFVSPMQVDPRTDRLVTMMRDLPPVPIQRIILSFDGGPDALFATPLECGEASADASFEPYGGGPPVRSVAPVSIQPVTPGTPCTRPGFSPRLVTESSTHRAGRLTVLSTVLVRGAGEQLPRTFTTIFPSGMSVRLGAVKPCPDAAVALGACPPESRIGSAQATIGSGPNPATLPGDVYLTGPFRRASLGLLTEFQGSLGPFSLGSIATRSALEMNRRNGRIASVTEDIPASVEGLPIRFQSIGLRLDRPGFVRNPTSCSPVSTNAVLESQSGVVAHAASSLELHGCRRLRFKPKTQIALLGKKEVREHGSPVLQVSTGLRSGGSNLHSMKLILPPVLKFRTGNLGQICSQRDAERGICPADSRIGTTFSSTSLLPERLQGAIHMVQPDGNGLPDMWVGLEGAGIQVDLRGHTYTTRDGHLVTVLHGLPDIPMSTFAMQLGGPRTQAIILQADPCAERRRFAATVVATAQNGMRRTQRVPIRTGRACAESAP
jgi:hypothetical protein